MKYATPFLMLACALAAKPNVLFIAVDDLRAELGCYGAAHVQSPNIDKLAARATLFQRAYCQQAVCNPSRASVLTGLRPSTLGIWDLPTHFRERRPALVTLPQHFKNHGYHTENIGKIFHNWRQDKWKGDAASWSVPAILHYGTHGSDKPVVKGRVPPSTVQVPRCESRAVPDDAYFDGRIADKAVAALQRLKTRKKPFFLAVGFWKPHADFNAPQKYWDLYDPGTLPGIPNPQPPRDAPGIALHDGREILRAFKSRPGGRPTAADARVLRHGYYAATSYVDAQLGKVLDALDATGLRDSTVVAFWSDHGFHLGEHGLWAKTSNFELDARVPLILAEPGSAKARRRSEVVELLDIYPTLAELCGLPTPAHVEGTSLVPLLDDAAEVPARPAFTWHPRPAYPSSTNPLKAMGLSMRTDRYRYTEWRSHSDGSVLARELYDHQSDPGEDVNLAGQAAAAPLLKSLSARMASTFPRHAD